MKKVFTLILALALGFDLNAQTSLTQAVDFTATDVNGSEIHLFDILDGGQAVLIYFFETTCTACSSPCSYLTESYQSFGCNLHDVFFLEVNYNEDEQTCLNWVSTLNVEFPTISGPAGGSAICHTYGIQGFPTAILIMPNHQIVIQDLWPINNAQVVNHQLETHGLQQHDCNAPTHDPQVTIIINQVLDSSVTVTFIPNEYCAFYHFMLATENEMQEWVSLSGLTLAEYIHILGSVELLDLSYTFSELIPDTEYNIYAVPTDHNGNLGSVSQATITTLPPSIIIYDPQVAINIEEVNESSITATFTPNTDCATYYYLCASETEIIGWIAMGTSIDEIIQEHGSIETDTLTHSFTDLLPNTEYRVAALPVDPNGNYGNVVQETITTLLPVVYDEMLTFSMDTVNIVENQYQYNWITVYNNTAEDALITRVCDQYEMLAFTWDGYNEFACYYDPIEITIPQGESIELGIFCCIIAKSDIETDIVTLSSNLPDASFVVLVEDPVSVEENETLVSLFPNPANESMTLKGENLGVVRVYNMLGQMLDEFEANSNELNINTTSYENGVYVIKACEQTLRFVVKH